MLPRGGPIPDPLCTPCAPSRPTQPSPLQCQSLRTQPTLDVCLRRVPPCELDYVKDDSNDADNDDDESGSSSCSSDSSAGDSSSTRYWWVYMRYRDVLPATELGLAWGQGTLSARVQRDSHYAHSRNSYIV